MIYCAALLGHVHLVFARVQQHLVFPEHVHAQDEVRAVPHAYVGHARHVSSIRTQSVRKDVIFANLQLIDHEGAHLCKNRQEVV